MSKKIFIISFLVILLIPIVSFNFFEKESTSEKRTLASFHHIIEDGHINYNFFKQMDCFLSDRVGLKNQFVALYNKIEFDVLKVKGNENVLIGKDKWLFLINQVSGNYSDFMKENLVSDEQAELFSQNILSIQNWCKQNDIKFLFVIAPNKHSIYPEKYSLKRPSGITRSDQLTEKLNQNNINYLFNRDLLLDSKNNEKDILYYETDTHWNELGSYLSFLSIQENLENQFQTTKFPIVDKVYTVKNENNGDLLQMIGLKTFRPKTEINFSVHKNNNFKYLKNADYDGIITENVDKSLPTALIYRDSFGSALVPFLSTQFSKVDYEWKLLTSDDKDFILQQKPDILIFEIVERNLNKLIDYSFN